MKKLLAISVVVLLVVSMFSGCTKKEDNTIKNTTSKSTTIKDAKVANVASLKGPSAISMVEMMSQNDFGNLDYKFKFDLVGSPDEMVSKISSSSVDIAVIPTNLASVLYNKLQGRIQTISINTLGTIYILDKNSNIKKISDLKGKTIYASGKGATPEYVLNIVLEKNGLKPGVDVNIEYKSEHAEVATLMATNKNAIAMLPEPFVSTVISKDSTIKTAFDLTKEYEAAIGGKSKLVMGVIVAKTDFIKNNKAKVDYFLKQYNKSQEYINSNYNFDSAANNIEKYVKIPAGVAKIAVPRCSIVCITGDEMKKQVSAYLKVLYDINPKSVGGKLPDDKFYYKK